MAACELYVEVSYQGMNVVISLYLEAEWRGKAKVINFYGVNIHFLQKKKLSVMYIMPAYKQTSLILVYNWIAARSNKHISKL